MKHSPLLSIITLTRDTAFWIAACLFFFLQQAYRNIEMLVVDGHSQDAFSGIRYKYMVGDHWIMAHYNQRQFGTGTFRSIGFEKTKGGSILFVGRKSTHLADCIKILQQSNGDGLYGDLTLRYSSGREQRITVTLPQKDEAMINYFLRTDYGVQTSTLFTAESIKSVTWDEILTVIKIYDLVIRYSKQYRFTVKYSNCDLSLLF